jgi:serine/threonine-protein kinase
MDRKQIEIVFESGQTFPIEWRATPEVDMYLGSIRQILMIRMEDKKPVEGFDVSFLRLGEGQSINDPAPENPTSGVLGATVSHYRILQQLGEGGMGTVFRAVDTRLGRHVALKLLKGEFSWRWQQEARALAALNHPNIGTLYDVGHYEGLPFLVMEFIHGTPIRGTLAPRILIEYGAQIAEALEAAHAEGIVHRDLKPGNILVTAAGVIKVLDFGIAKLMNTSRPMRGVRGEADNTSEGQPTTAKVNVDRTQSIHISSDQDLHERATESEARASRGVIGTPGYISPEQLRGQAADQRSDIFALGCVLYELACGHRAFRGNSIDAVLRSTLDSEPTFPSSLTGSLNQLIHSCIAKNPAERPQRATDVKILLRSILRGMPDQPSET